jgi:outer membrane protein OmpU
MNKFKKIGLSALAGSLVAMSAHAEVTMSGGASVAMTHNSDTDGMTYYQNDSFTFKYSGETDGGLTITTSVEMDGDATGLSAGVDSESIAIGLPGMGTVTFSGHGGDSVVGGWDDVMPTAYEEVFALTRNSTDAAVGAGNIVIAGASGNNLWRYDSPSFSGVSVHAAYQAANATTGRSSSYSDMGIQIAPEMVEGLSLGYATGEYDESASILGIDVTTMWVKYAYGPVTVGYQTSENDGPTATQDDDSTSYAISYAITDDFSVSYGEHELDLGSATAAGTDQESSAWNRVSEKVRILCRGGAWPHDALLSSRAAQYFNCSYRSV